MTMGRRRSSEVLRPLGTGRAGNPALPRQRLALRTDSDQVLLRLAADRDLARLRHRHLGDLDYQDAVLEACLDLILLDVARQLNAAREAPVGQLTAQIAALLRARLLLVLCRDVQHPVGVGQLDLLRRETWYGRLDLIGLALVDHVNRQVPTTRAGLATLQQRPAKEVAEQPVHRRMQAGQLSHRTPATQRHLSCTSCSDEPGGSLSW